jgi:hypothetical protein
MALASHITPSEKNQLPCSVTSQMSGLRRRSPILKRGSDKATICYLIMVIAYLINMEQLWNDD